MPWRWRCCSTSTGWRWAPTSPTGCWRLDTLSVNAVALIVLIGIALGSDLYFEAALLIAMIGFVSTVAFCKYVLRGDVIE